ncbi:FMN-binding negative transcriptional regulator [soil metagenome]
MVYLPAHFEEQRPEAIHDLIRAQPLGTIVHIGADGLVANHIPFLIEPARGPHGTLIAHVARNNDLWREVKPGVESLVVFQGPDAYISPNWYATKRETHEVVPTYNYAVVHAYGEIQVHDDEKWVRGVIGKLTKAMEALQPTPWKMADAPRDYLTMMVGNIVGIEIEITRLIGKTKLSQNRNLADREGAITGLRTMNSSGDSAAADAMESLLQEETRSS